MQIQLLDLQDVRSPLKYPGGKIKLWPTFKEYLPSDITTLVSPFIGGGAIELACTGRNIQVFSSDNNEQLVNFWQQFLKDSSSVIGVVKDLYPLSLDAQYHYYNNQIRPSCSNMDGKTLSNIERAAVYLCINKQSYRGWGLNSPPTKFHQKYRDDYFDQFIGWKNNKITVVLSDFQDVIHDRNSSTLYYLDPPYVGKENFYGDKKDKPTFDHERLSELLRSLNNRWILSYGDHPLVRSLYSGYDMIEPKWSYSIQPTGDRKSQELLILNI